MSDQYEYVDENGDPIDPSELGDDVEFIDEEVDEVVEDTPAAAEPVVPTSEPVSAPTAAAAPTKVPKALLAGVAAAVLLLGGGAAYGLSQLGNQDSVEQVKAAATKKTEELKDEARADIDACDGKQVAAASYGKGGGDKPKMQLRVTDVTALPPGYAERVRGLGDRAADRVTMLQQSTGDLGIYVQEEPKVDQRTNRKQKAGWWKVSASTDAQGARVLGEEQGTGDDQDAATACKTVKGGVYAVTGDDVPEAARGMRDGQVVVDSLKPDGATAEVVWLVMGDQLARSVLEYAPAQESEAGDAEQTATATTTTEKGR